MKKGLKRRFTTVAVCAVLTFAVMLSGCTVVSGTSSSGIVSVSSEQDGSVSVSGIDSDSTSTYSSDSQSTDTSDGSLSNSSSSSSSSSSSNDSSGVDSSSADSTPTESSSADSTSTDSTSVDSTGTDNSSGNSSSDSSASGSQSSGSSTSTSSGSAADSESTDSSSSSTSSSSGESGDDKGTDSASTIITAAGGYEESLYVTWETGNASNDRIMYKLSGESGYTTFTDSNLITTLSATEARADIVGLTAGEYDIQILSGSNYYTETVTVDEYDRSGYAHFNYNDGVGAYNDDGTLKNNTVVIYLTDSNKNDITDYVYLYNDGSLTHVSASTVESWFSSSAGGYGIGYLLNNNTYGDGISMITDTYAGVTIRVIGTVNAEVDGDGKSSEIEGLTAWTDKTDIDGDGVYDKDDGDDDGDNGRMARMVNAKNVTVEGVGEDATIYGWGIHFICSDTTGQSGYGFEVRNITFTHYSEDAIGMEGKASGTTITAPVQRCWIHNNSFYVGYCAADSTWEGDKGDGDGSCDFKRGEYFTFSYNYLEGCHKTNLIGANETCPQYNLTIHHNYYNTCQSRMPLIRMANLHYYNNYVYGATNSAISSRSNNYTYSEYNYYENNNTAIEVVTDKYGDSGAVKSYSDVFVSNTTNQATIVTSRTQSVTNTCYDKGKGVDYSTFDTDSTLFYYNDYSLMPDAAAAKEEVIASAGVHTSDSSSSGSAASGTSVEVNISDLEVGTLADGYKLADGVYVSASSGMDIDAKSSKTYNEVTYTNRLKTGGAVYSAAIEIVATGACTVTVYVTTSNSSDDKLVGLFNSKAIDDVYVATQSIAASSSMPIYALTFKIYSAGTYYLGNGTSSGGINIYYLAVTY